MGKELERIFDIVAQRGGFDARMEFASRTGLSKSKVAKAKDTPDLKQKLLKIAAEVLGREINDFD
ncbi:MAG: hypothetical protein HKM93_07070 [Desulfobacteraceae bacterium]|nr:hypothetical protein [Desulfobacteraceae bacterium]